MGSTGAGWAAARADTGGSKGSGSGSGGGMGTGRDAPAFAGGTAGNPVVAGGGPFLGGARRGGVAIAGLAAGKIAAGGSSGGGSARGKTAAAVRGEGIGEGISSGGGLGGEEIPEGQGERGGGGGPQAASRELTPAAGPSVGGEPVVSAGVTGANPAGTIQAVLEETPGAWMVSSPA